MITAEDRYSSYPLQLTLTYATRRHSGKSRTVQIGPDIVTFLSDANLGAGTPIELKVDWPSTQDEDEPLELILSGRIANAAGQAKTVEVLRHEFRTRSSSRG
jgi:hypothetical protein